MKLKPLEGDLKKIVACGTSDVTPAVATRSTTVDMEVKWQLNLRKRFLCWSYILHTL